ncbi:unnamed protein product [Rhizophagus irregularis]|nr:unnamed protein product [Rhizophagus irregularis]
MNLWLESWENSILNSVLYGRRHQELAYVKVLRSALKCQLENNAPIHLYTARDYVLVPDEQQRSRPAYDLIQGSRKCHPRTSISYHWFQFATMVINSELCTFR